MNSYKYEKPQLILKIDTKIINPFIICLNDNRISVCSLEESTKIYNAYSFKVDIILNGVLSDFQIQLSNDYILFNCKDHIKVVELYDNNEYEIIQKVVSISHSFWDFTYKLKIWDIDEDFNTYLCKSNIKKSINLNSNIIFIEDNNEIGAISYDDHLLYFKFWKIEEDNSLKETHVLNGFCLNNIPGIHSFVYKTKKFLKILIWNKSTIAQIYFADWRTYKVVYAYHNSLENIHKIGLSEMDFLNSFDEINEIGLSNGDFLFSISFNNILLHYKFENNDIIILKKINIYLKGAKILELKNDIILTYDNNGCLLFWKWL